MHTHQREPNPARGIGRTALAFYAMNTVEDSFTQGPGSSTDAKGQKVDPEDMAEGGTYTNALQDVALAPGTTKTFNMCFEASGHNGVYSFTYDPTFFTTEDKTTWSIELTDE